MGSILSTPVRAQAGEILHAGATITRADGTVVTLVEDVLVLERTDVERLVVQTRDLERCNAALEACGKESVKPAGRPPWLVIGSVAVAVFAAGAAAGAVAVGR